MNLISPVLTPMLALQTRPRMHHLVTDCQPASDSEVQPANACSGCAMYEVPDSTPHHHVCNLMFCMQAGIR